MPETIDVNPNDRPKKSQSEQSPIWGRRILTVLIALAAIGGFAAIVVYSYDDGNSNGTDGGAPVITAQQTPMKVRPKVPGGMAVPNRDKQIYGRLNAAEKSDKAERLLPPPEAVVSKPKAGRDPTETAAMTQKDLETAAKKLSAITPSSGKAGGGANLLPPPPPAAVTSNNKMAAIQPGRSRTKMAAKKMDPAPRQIAKLAPKPAMKSGASFRIQIASLRSQGDAKKAWGRLAKQHKDLFSSLQSKIVRINLKGKGTFYRLQAGPLADRPTASKLCSKLKKRKIGCLVVKP